MEYAKAAWRGGVGDGRDMEAAADEAGNEDTERLAMSAVRPKKRPRKVKPQKHGGDERSRINRQRAVDGGCMSSQEDESSGSSGDEGSGDADTCGEAGEGAAGEGSGAGEVEDVRAKKLRAMLLSHYGYSRFRPDQLETITAALDGKDTGVFWATSAGKSLCFQMVAMYTQKVVFVITPLIALMQDQVQPPPHVLRHSRTPSCTLSYTLIPTRTHAPPIYS